MRVIAVLSVFICCVSFTNRVVDSCPSYFPITKGMSWEYEEFDKNEKLTGYTKTSVTNVKSNGSAVEYTMKIESDDAKRKEKNHFEREVTYSCEDGILKMNLDNLIPAETMQGMENMTVDIKQNGVVIPKSLEAGQTLADGSIIMNASTNGIKVMGIEVYITDRKVEKIEKLTTTAGTFDCAVVSYKVSTKMGFVNTTGSGKDWYAKEVGCVKSETYDKKGELSNRTVLTSFNK